MNYFINEESNRVIEVDGTGGVTIYTRIAANKSVVFKADGMHTVPENSPPPAKRAGKKDEPKTTKKEEVEEMILAGEKPAEIAKKCKVSVQTVYTVKNMMKRKGMLDAAAPTRKKNGFKPEVLEDVYRMVDEHRNSLEIANKLNLEMADVNRIISQRYGVSSD